LLLASGWLGTLVARDPGYVLVAWREASFETSVWFALLLLLLFLAGLWLLGRGWRMLASSRAGVLSWTSRRLQRRAQRATTRGLLDLARGDAGRARKALLQAAPRVEAPLVNYLAAARAAQEEGDAEGRDEALEQALATTPDATFAVGLTRAELLVAARSWEAALATLLSLRREQPRSANVLRLLRRVHEALEDWPALAELAPDLERAGVVDEDALRRIRRRCWRAQLDRSLREGAGAGDLEALFSALPGELREEPGCVAAQADALVGVGEPARAEALLRKTLERRWDPTLVERYGRIEGVDAARRLKTARGWVDDHRDDPALHLALGRLAVAAGQPERAREHLETSLGLRADPEAHLALARLAAEAGDAEEAAQRLRTALALREGARSAAVADGRQAGGADAA
ncbi:MAG: heme biosynthesis HemY N-terminal domain-containing protein, partial [Pseudomonadales bacterium]|nr:heme biosynthesis HemY N-terminal domain-containing protein [Pseudomonadales bacterium]